jgi:hypothetical protein
MFEVEVEARLYLGCTAEHAVSETVKSMMAMGSDVMRDGVDGIAKYEALREQLQRNRNG